MTYEEITYLTRIIGLLYFMAMFLAVIVWVFLPRNQAGFERAARLPLDEGNER